MLSATSKEQLVSNEKLSLKIISSTSNDYDSQLAELTITPPGTFLDQQSIKYINNMAAMVKVT